MYSTLRVPEMAVSRWQNILKTNDTQPALLANHAHVLLAAGCAHRHLPGAPCSHPHHLLQLPQGPTGNTMAYMLSPVCCLANEIEGMARAELVSCIPLLHR
jgi:hypothetical protein